MPTTEPTLRAICHADGAKLWSWPDGKGQITMGDEQPDHGKARLFDGIVSHLYLDEWREVDGNHGSD
jgi:hypothetical protein